VDDTDSTEDTPDEKADDEKAGDDGDGDEDGGEPSEERLEEVGRHIEQARSRAEDAVEGVEADEERFTDSGDEESEEEDDQSIAPG
jgi:hypothetical protein